MINYIRKKFLKFEKAPSILKRTPRNFLWAVLSFGEHEKENRESAKIVWPMATSTSLLPTHPKRTLALGYLGYRKRLALSVFSLSCSPKLGTAYKKWLGVRFRMGGAFSNFDIYFLILIIN